MGSGGQHLEEIDDMANRWDYASATIRYQGHASPGAAETDEAWRIKRMTFDSQGRLTKTEYANSNANYRNVWANRASLTYG